ncbi:DUF4124 domain-containing protein [Xanthomonas hortorum]|uniref:DUF4124 domain-containing protein n=2 Tax=Xanthomonas hortorum pv. pelargonii TaxID=453602 RepID=A0A6V7EJU3_9XANT|nr:DUF4124 domain-containing protein [Xanthomonas hortorum]MCE4352592.1 DUF4124 domain-containing protein [Xanthomonas hortorum pv. pelargonii]MCM5525913.1 DUF4124 domain-containing protein [Xanthomonas hortorum pv. pelargonii]MCM5538216.1 DUF4124 domain-containing protein [Xanthomonas hortorum pv. pelargonii]MCM5542414.1 DUF4124 domain-containing protein [Xanthomonas hortorum pv. pelargonii]MCM5546453.1 DUF4124 domain-containing protein [Xanthomonas hortorum pv. pelargonii]
MQLSSGLCALLMLVSAGAGATDLYKWKDAKSVTHYTETPPPSGQRYESRRIDARSGTAAIAAPETAAPESTDCLTARRNLELLSGTGEVTMGAGADGKPGTPLDPDARTAQRNLAEAAAKAYCKPAPTSSGPAT